MDSGMGGPAQDLAGDLADFDVALLQSTPRELTGVVFSITLSVRSATKLLVSKHGRALRILVAANISAWRSRN